jgi:hypothetical protein
VDPKCVLAESADGSQVRYGRIGWIKEYGAQQRPGVLTVALVVVSKRMLDRFVSATSLDVDDHHQHVSGCGRRARQHIVAHQRSRLSTNYQAKKERPPHFVALSLEEIASTIPEARRRVAGYAQMPSVRCGLLACRFP